MKNEHNCVYGIIKNFLLTVFTVMCVCAMLLCVSHAGNVTAHFIDGSQPETVSLSEVQAFFGELKENYISQLLY